MINSILSAIMLLASSTEISLAVAVGAGIAVLTSIGAGIGIGIATGKACEATAKNPEAEEKIQKMFMIGLAFAEATALNGLLISFLILFM